MKRPRRRRSRWWCACRLLLLLGLLAIIGLGALAWTADYVLKHTTLPRDIAVAQIQQQTGLLAKIDRVAPTWVGRITVEGIELKLPTETDPLAVVPSVELTLGPLWMVALTQTIDIQHVAMAGPELFVRQHAAGHWHVQELIERLIARFGSSDPGAKPSAYFKLPDIDIIDARLTIEEASGRSLTLSPVQISGQTKDGQFEATVDAEQKLALKAKVYPGGSWRHEAEFSAADLRNKVAPWFDGLPDNAQVRGKWTGAVVDGQLAANFELDQATYEQLAATGAFTIQAGAEAVRIEPRGIDVTPKPWLDDLIAVQGGAVVLGLKDLTCDLRGIEIVAWQGGARIDGEADLRTLSADTTVVWRDIRYPADGFRSEGELQASIAPTAPGQFAAKMSLTTLGETPFGQWDVVMTASAAAASMTEAQAQVKWPRLVLRQGDQVLTYDGAHAELDLEGSRATLVSLATDPPSLLTASGWYDLKEQTWQASARGDRLPIDLPDIPDGAYSAVAQGGGNVVESLTATFTGDEASAEATGSYDPKAATPLKAKLTLRKQALALALPATTGLQGDNLKASLDVHGSIKPMKVQAAGEFALDRVRTGEKMLQETFRVNVTGNADDQAATFQSAPFDIFEGKVAFGADFPWRGSGTLRAQSDGLSIASIAALAGAPVEVEGSLSQRARYMLPRSADERPTLQGSLDMQGVKVAGMPVGVIRATQSLADGVLSVSDLVIEGPSGRVTGMADLDLPANKVKAKVDIEKWTAELPIIVTAAPEQVPAAGDVVAGAEPPPTIGELPATTIATEPAPEPDANAATPVKPLLARVDITGRFDAQADLATLTAQGNLMLTSACALDGQPVGQQSMIGVLEGKSLQIKEIGGQLFGGKLDGQGTLRWDRPLQSQLNVTWKELDLARAIAVAEMKDLRGRIDGSLSIGPPAKPGDHERLLIKTNVSATGASFRKIAFKGGQLDGYVEMPDGLPRMVVSRSQWLVSDGEVNAWGRLTPNRGRYFGYGNVRIEGMNIEPVVRSFVETDKVVAGLLSAEFRAMLPIDRTDHMYGQGRVSVSESDLAGVPVLQELYQLFNIDFGDKKPEGRGEGRGTLEGRRLTINSFRYSNRGLFVQAGGSVDDVQQVAKANVNAYAITSLNPLPEFAITRQVQKAFSALQAGLTPVSIRGPVNDIKVEQIPAANTFATLKALFDIDRGKSVDEKPLDFDATQQQEMKKMQEQR